MPSSTNSKPMKPWPKWKENKKITILTRKDLYLTIYYRKIKYERKFKHKKIKNQNINH